ncbi:MAG: hypothetical protein E7C86_01395 [Paeniclostridium sordellii]|uniref:Uncharacterized protein n=1 Tax=Paeniclostridium hominis TaxID=2764329 RepID=A0ABR7K4X4_9FIRM|nr:MULTISPECIES: hypothetical protein [Paeniclostridium]MBC6004125.1 hypothetical protein [Paeniclostridium hominis]MDU2591259.1 hypothetical protein [Paeniclostridium sordellii]
MKDNEIKKVFDKIKVDESMKSRIYENVYKDLNTNKESKKSKFNIIYLNHKKSLSTLAASLVLICGLFLYNENKVDNMQNLSMSNEHLNTSISRSRAIIENNEFNNFEFEILKDNTTKVEIKNNENTNVFKEITNEKSINNLLNLLQDAKEKDFNPESYDNFKDTGKIITLSFITKDGLTSSIKINLDLKIACINEKYYTVSFEVIKIIDEELKNIKDFNKN